MLRLLVVLFLSVAATGCSGGARVPAPPDVAAPPPDSLRTPSGLSTRVLQPGSGQRHPRVTDTVVVHYSGWTTDGEMFDSSIARGQPAEFRLDGVIPGWTEGVQLMVKGEKRRLWIPEHLAYKGAEPKGMLVFDIELIDTRRSPTIPPVDVKGPPDDAMRTSTGLAYKVLRPGTGTRRPAAWSRVLVHYTGWTTDGKMFDSSVAGGQPLTFGLDEVIPGWTEGVQMMVEGEKRRLWIPESLAYQGQSGKPAGMLVFDVELIKIES